MLKVSNITIKSSARTVISDVSLELAKGEIVALLGPNGAGKSELVLGIAGVMPLASGAVAVNDAFVNGTGVQAIRAAGVAAVPEGHQVLGGLSVIDNLRAAGPMLTPSERDAEAKGVFAIFPELRDIQHQKAGSLSGGQQQMVAIGQALVSRPQFLLIDEMSLGLAPVIISRLIGVIRDLRERGIGILLIEQFTQLALDIADRCYVLSQGKIQFEGSSAQLKTDHQILERAYLGT